MKAIILARVSTGEEKDLFYNKKILRCVVKHTKGLCLGCLEGFEPSLWVPQTQVLTITP